MNGRCWIRGPRGLSLRACGALLGACLVGQAPVAAQVAPSPDPSVAAAPAYPDDPRLETALRMLAKGSPDLARMASATVLAERPDCDRAAALQGIALNKMKRYEEAKPLLQRASRSTQPFPEQRHAAHFLGWCHYHLGELADARRAFEAHLAAVPGEPDSTFGLGVIALDEDRLTDASAHFDQALAGFSTPKDRPSDRARVLVRMSDLALRNGDVAGAEALLRRSIDASALQHETWSKLARICDRLGKEKEADAARANAERILTAMGRKSREDAPLQPAEASAPPDSAAAPAATGAVPASPASPQEPAAPSADEPKKPA